MVATPKTIHAFCSAKGGVGKSTLAVACAKLLAGAGRVCVLIDADLTGTSLSDGLRLCAPRVDARPQSPLSLDAPPLFESWAETLRLRNEREKTTWTTDPPRPWFLNDALLTDATNSGGEGDAAGPPSIARFLWAHETHDGVWYMPSSPLRHDVAIALGWLHFEAQHAWIRRMAWLIEELREQVTGLSDVVLDLPPGLFGFAHEVLTLLSYLDQEKELPEGYPPSWNTEEGRWLARPFLVTTQDRNDLAVAVRYFLTRKNDIPSLIPLINRRREPIESIAEDVRERFEVDVGPETFRAVDDLPKSFGLTFTRGGDLPMAEGTETLGQALGLFGRGVAP